MLIHNQPIYVAEPKNPEFLKDWREHAYSLTDKLQAALGSIQLEVISQLWKTPDWWDTHFLGIANELVFQREIMMKHHNVEYWYARTIIPYTCYYHDAEFFKRLEKESLKHLIFDTPRVNRIHRIDYSINSSCIEYHWVKKQLSWLDDILWIRLAEYSLDELQSFYLAEILLPELGKLP